MGRYRLTMGCSAGVAGEVVELDDNHPLVLGGIAVLMDPRPQVTQPVDAPHTVLRTRGEAGIPKR